MRELLIIVAFLSMFIQSYSQSMKKTYEKEVLAGLERTKNVNSDILTEMDIQHLPSLVQRYLRYVGAVGKEKVVNFRVEFEGVIRSNPEDKWMKLTSAQYNFTDNPTRVFYIKARKMGIPASGIHLYKQETAIMHIKLAGLFTIVNAQGPEMNQGETVTVFNDMCFMAPATLIDKRIRWEEIDSSSVKAYFTNGGIIISATLFFNETGELINFISNDRFETKDGKTYKNYPWVTPVFGGYAQINGYRLRTEQRQFTVAPKEIFAMASF